MQGFYCTVQFCPDIVRAEVVNVGVLLFVPTLAFLDVRFDSELAGLRRFSTGAAFDLERIRYMVKSVEARLKKSPLTINTLEDLQRFVATRGNQLQLAVPRLVAVDEPASTLKRLYERLVVTNAPAPRTRPSARALRKRLKAQLSLAGLRDRIEFDRQIRIPVIGLERTVPFAYKNGHWNLIDPIEFRGDPAIVLRRALEISAEGRLLHEHPAEAENAQLVVVYRFATDRLETAVGDRIRTVLECEGGIRALPEQEIDTLVESVRKDAHILREGVPLHLPLGGS